MIVIGNAASPQPVQNSVRETNMLKFANKQGKKQLGIRCNPQQTYGISNESPEHFKNRHTLSPTKGYHFKFDTHANHSNFEYFSQKHFIQIGGLPNQSQGFTKNFQSSYQKNRLSFHRKKGRLSDFMDKNGWMSKDFIIMGNERDKVARNLSNRDRSASVRDAQSKLTQKQRTMSLLNTTSATPRKIEMRKFSSGLITEKTQIRALRNEMADICSSRPVTTNSVNKRRKSNQFADTSSSLRLPGSKKTLDDWKNYGAVVDNINWDSAAQDGNFQKWKTRKCGQKFVNPESTGQKFYMHN